MVVQDHLELQVLMEEMDQVEHRVVRELLELMVL
jgi:hypothetical protein